MSRVTARCPSTWSLAWPVGVFVIISLFLAGDLAADIAIGMSAWHVGLEILALSTALLAVVGTTWQLWGALRHAHELHHDLQGARADLEGTRADLERWRGEAEGLMRKLGTAIEHHFVRWDLTSAEREVALLVLRGLSYKEIASVRGTTDRTVRVQALAIYRKAGVAGRAEMAAFFLKDLLLPAAAAEPDPGETASRAG